MVTDIKYVILLLEMARALDRDLTRGISKYSRLQSHCRWAFYSGPESRGLPRTIPKLRDWDADGIIAYDPTPKHTKAIIDLHIPAVTRGIKIAGCPHIISDSQSISQMAADHLIERGYTHFAYCGFDRIRWSQLRGAFFSEYIQQAGHHNTVYTQPRLGKRLQWEQEQSYMAQWLKSLTTPVAIFACNDDRARHVIEACKIANIDVPTEIAVLGVDNDEFVCELSDPPLSSIALNTEWAGFEAAKLLDDMMHRGIKHDVEIVIKPTHVLTRQSTDMLAIRDPDVAKAVNYIQLNAKKLIQVDDVVNATTLSRRVLEKRFRNYIHCSILEKIHHNHIRQIIQILIETNLSVSEIASIMGYPSDKHIARTFRKYTGMSPLAYRKKYGRQ
jgi:LacI family transcriptional regulator